MFALELAIDELPRETKVDPLELRKNYSERDQQAGKPYSTKELRECYQRGAERLGLVTVKLGDTGKRVRSLPITLDKPL